MQFIFTFSLFCVHFCNLWNDLTLEIDLMIIHIIHCSCNLAFEINLSTYLFQDVSLRPVSHAPTIRAVSWPL